MKCALCSKEAVIYLPYAGSSFCGSHFIERFERVVKKEVRDQIRFHNNSGRISVALSGGKDSSVTLYSLASILGRRKNVNLTAFTVDEGIRGYRDRSIETARKLCNNLGIDHEVISYSNVFDTTMDDQVSAGLNGKSPCAICGPMRRQLINMAADRTGSDYVALGMNSDDIAQSVLMNVSRGDLDRLLRMAPHRNGIPGLIPRVTPLRSLSEREVLLYSMLKEIPHDSGWCPYYSQAQRNLFRNVADQIEERYPGSKLAMGKLQGQVRKAISQEKEISIDMCRKCGMPSSSELCSVCRNSGDT